MWRLSGELAVNSGRCNKVAKAGLKNSTVIMCSSCLQVQFQVICIQFTSNITLIKQFPNVIYVNHEQQRPDTRQLP